MRIPAILAITVSQLVSIHCSAITPEEAADAAVQSLRAQGIKADEAKVRAAIKAAAARVTTVNASGDIVGVNRQGALELGRKLTKSKVLPQKYSTRLARTMRDINRAAGRSALPEVPEPSSQLQALQHTILDAINEGELSTIERARAYRVLADVEVAAQTPATAETSFAKTGNPLDWLGEKMENNFRIRDDSEGINGVPEADDPAKIAWVKPRGEKSFYTIDAAIMWTPEFLTGKWSEMEKAIAEGSERNVWISAWRARPSFEAHVSTELSAQRNQLAYAVPFEYKRAWAPGDGDGKALDDARWPGWPFSGHAVSISPTYITDRTEAIRTYGLDFIYEPTIPALHMNTEGPSMVGNLKWLEVGTTGRVGFIYRSIEDGGETVGYSGDYGQLHIVGGVKMILFKRLTLAASYVGDLSVWGDADSHDFFEASAELLLDNRNHFSVGLSYQRGEEEPTFEEVDTLIGWVGVRF